MQKTLVTLMLCFCVTLARGQSSQTLETSANQKSAFQIPRYPNSSTGLQDFIADALSAFKSRNSSALSLYGQSLVLPQARSWLTSKFGDSNCDAESLAANDCLGPRLALAYDKYSETLAGSFEMTLRDLLAEGLTSFEVVDYTQQCASPLRIVPSLELTGDLTTTPVLSAALSGLVKNHEPVYVLWAYGHDKETTVAFFVYLDGFRFIGMPHPVSAEEYSTWRKSGAVAEDAVPAHYLSNEQLPMPGRVEPGIADRTVVLQVHVDSDGKPNKIEYVRGPQELKELAVRSVSRKLFDHPGFGPHGFHGNTLCFNWTPEH